MGVGEDTLQSTLLQYTRRFIDAAVGRGYFASSEEAAEYNQNIKRRTLFWSASKACERWESTIEARVLKDFSVDKAIQQFVFSKSIPDDTLLDLFNKIRTASSSPERTAEIRVIITHYNCINVLGCAMMHASQKIRETAKFFMYNMKFLQKVCLFFIEICSYFRLLHVFTTE